MKAHSLSEEVDISAPTSNRRRWGDHGEHPVRLAVRGHPSTPIRLETPGGDNDPPVVAI
jgi:hypothetical protein